MAEKKKVITKQTGFGLWTAELRLTQEESREIAREKSFNFSIALNVEVKAGLFVCSRRLDTMFRFLYI